MKAPAKLAAYAVVLAIVTGGGAVVGAAAGPIDVGGDAGDEAGHDMGSGSEAEDITVFDRKRRRPELHIAHDLPIGLCYAECETLIP